MLAPHRPSTRACPCAVILPHLLPSLRLLAEADMSDENLLFWVQVNAFKAAYDAWSEEERARQSVVIIDEFLKEGSKYQVCIGGRSAHSPLLSIPRL